MARGRRSQVTITLTPEERAHLEHLLRQRSQPTWLHQRVRMVLLRAQGVPIVHIATAIGITPPHVYHWLRAWQYAGLTGITAAGFL
jgi:DNA-binding transcriptional ArsR family regulator